MGLGSRKDLKRANRTMGGLLPTHTVEGKTKNTPNTRNLKAAKKALKDDTVTWRESKKGLLGKAWHTAKAALGSKTSNMAGQCSDNTCVKFEKDMATKANLSFPETEDNRTLVKEFDKQGFKGSAKYKKDKAYRKSGGLIRSASPKARDSKKGDYVVFSRPTTEDEKKEHGDWYPYHIGTKTGRNKYIGSDDGPTKEKKIYKKGTRGHKVDYYTPKNKYTAD